LPFKQAWELATSGEFIDTKTIAALALLLAERT